MASVSHFLLLFLALLHSEFVSTTALSFPKLGLHREIKDGKFSISQPSLEDISFNGYSIYNYTQTLDHFNYRPESYATFQQRYAINYEYWGGAKNNSPIFVYTGDEASLEIDVAASGFLLDNAAHFQALLVVIEVIFCSSPNDHFL